jgi:protein SEY1
VKDTDWSYEDELESLKEDITLIANQLRSDETKKMVNLIEVCLLSILVFWQNG